MIKNLLLGVATAGFLLGASMTAQAACNPDETCKDAIEDAMARLKVPTTPREAVKNVQAVGQAVDKCIDCALAKVQEEINRATSFDANSGTDSSD